MKYKTKRIQYKCVKTPDGTALQGFEKNKTYKGRTFNGLFEISEEWATHKPTYLLEKKEFDKAEEVLSQMTLENLEFEPQFPKDSVAYDTIKIDSILRARLVDFPKVNPAIKRGIPVKTQFVLPVIIKSE